MSRERGIPDHTRSEYVMQLVRDEREKQFERAFISFYFISFIFFFSLYFSLFFLITKEMRHQMGSDEEDSLNRQMNALSTHISTQYDGNILYHLPSLFFILFLTIHHITRRTYRIFTHIPLRARVTSIPFLPSCFLLPSSFFLPSFLRPSFFHPSYLLPSSFFSLYSFPQCLLYLKAPPYGHPGCDQVQCNP